MYLVTGGAGFIGSHIVDRLIAEGERIRILDNFSTGAEENISDVLDCDRLELINGDISDHATVKNAMKGVKGVFHHAALVSVKKSIEDPKSSFTNNVSGVFNIFEAAREERVDRIVFASSAAIYGNKQELPIDEKSSYQPNNPYALDKTYAEQLAKIYFQRYQLQSVALRYFNVYGPRQNPTSPYSGVVSLFLHQAQNGKEIIIYGDGEQTRDFVFVDDVINANILAMETSGLGAACFNVGTGNRKSINQLLDIIGIEVGCDFNARYVEKRQGDIQHSYALIKHALEILGWEPQFDLKQGISAMINTL